MGAHARAVALTGSDQAVRAAAGIYCGFAAVETGGASSVSIRVYDHASAASGTLIDAVDLAAGESAARLYDRGTWCENGIYVDISGSGTVAGSIRVG